MKFDYHNLDVLYEDNHIIVVVKPVGILSQGDNTGNDDMVNLLKAYLKEKYNKPGNVFVGLVHRLDRMVGGVMVFAKTSKGASRLSDVIRRREFHKKYMAVLEGIPKTSEGKLVHYIEKNEKNNCVKVYDKQIAKAKEASLEYVIADNNNNMSLADIELHTGRPHQIRAQFAHVGCPLVGDVKYGNKKPNSINGPALWSYKISFKHPVKDDVMTFSCLPPKEDYPWCKFAETFKNISL